MEKCSPLVSAGLRGIRRWITPSGARSIESPSLRPFRKAPKKISESISSISISRRNEDWHEQNQFDNPISRSVWSAPHSGAFDRFEACDHELRERRHAANSKRFAT